MPNEQLAALGQRSRISERKSLGVLTWAKRQGYLRFRPLSGDVAREPNPIPTGSALPSLGIQEMVPARASGWFTVEGENQYYIDLEADFETVGTREHIVLARVHPSRYLLFGQWPKVATGTFLSLTRMASRRASSQPATSCDISRKR